MKRPLTSRDWSTQRILFGLLLSCLVTFDITVKLLVVIMIELNVLQLCVVTLTNVFFIYSAQCVMINNV